VAAAGGSEDFEDLYEHAPCGYISVSPDGVIAKANRTIAAWGGVSADDLVGTRFHAWLQIASRMYYETHLLPLLHLQGHVHEVALDFSFQGKKFPALVNFVERRDEGGVLRHVRLTIFNASDRRRYEAELLAARAAAQKASDEVKALNRILEARVGELEAARLRTDELLRQSQKMEAIGQLTGGIAHDFNNLIAGITGSLELLDRRIEQGRLDSLSRYVSAARGAAKRAATLTHRLLTFSRRQAFEPMPTDVNRVIGDLEDMIRRAVGTSMHLEVIGAGGLWTAVVDRNQLENALLNLCINARDAMPSGGKITVETSNKWLDQPVAVERELTPGQYVALCVTDTGTGMTPEVLARAFDPFFTTKSAGQGTGLGLAMVQAFAQQSGGQVRIYTEVNHGTTICIYLPRHGGPPTEMEPLNSTTGTWPSLHSETILIVDDEPTVRMLVSEAMTDAGYRVVEAVDGPTALRLLESSARFDVLITDFSLPGGLTGRQLVDVARRKREELKVLFITGYAENAMIENGHLAVGSVVLTKPFSLEALTRAVAALLAQ
jgi:PAS domain S-box-containing protein